MSLDPIKAIETTLGVNKTAAKIAIGGWIVLTLAISLKQYLADETVTFWQMLVALVGLILLMMLLSELPRLVARVTVSFLCVLFMLWATAGLAQVVTNNGMTFLGHYRCIFSLGMSDGCGASLPNASGEGQSRGVVQAPVAPAPAPDAPAAAGTGGGGIAALPQAVAPSPGSSPTRSPTRNPSLVFAPPQGEVILMHTGYDRDEMTALSGALAGAGWNLPAAARGGDRIDAARGLNEVRFFNAADLGVARQLAVQVSASLPGRPGLELRDLSGTRHARPAGSHFEIWLSR